MKLRIEVPFSLLMFAFVFADSITTNWIMYRTCYVTLGYNESECALIGSKHPDNSTAELSKKVQPYVTVISMTKTLVEAFGSAFVCFFIGPWSDRFGRKPVFLLTFGGYIIAYFTLAIVSAIPNLSPWFLLLFVVPLCASGGLMAVFSAVLSYLTDTTPEEMRGIRMAIFYAVGAGAVLLGSLSSSFALAAFGYYLVYAIAACCIFLAWILIFLFLSESVSNPQTEGKIRNLFRLSLMKVTVKATFTKRENYGRGLLLTIIAFLVIYLLAKAGDSYVYLYTQNRFHWTLEMFTVFSSINVVTEVIGGILGIYILRVLLRFKESVVVMIGFCSIFASALLLGLATSNWQIYAASSAKCLGSIISPLSRALLSKIIPSEDTGKVFSFVAVCETLISPLGSPLYTFIYNNTFSTFPQAFTFVTAGIYLVGICLTMFAITLQRKRALIPYDTLNEEAVVS